MTDAHCHVSCGDPAVREEITSLLSASLGIGTHKVKVSAKK